MSIKDDKLHISELSEKFRAYNNISVDDFNNFYRDVFGDISRKTVSWYIYQLKKIGIIRNVSRGQYVLEDRNQYETKSKKEYIVITMDIIESSKFEYQEFDKVLRKKIDSLNKIIRKVYKVDREFHVSQGDEVQIIIPFNIEIEVLVTLTLSYLYPFEARYAISIGEINDELDNNSWNMNGPIFWNARDQLKTIKKNTSYQGVVISGYSRTDQLCNNILPLINKMFSKITEKQWVAIKFELSKIEINDALKEIGISKTSYYDRLNASNLNDILSSYKALRELIEVRREIY
ncbi:MAG: SatD family protein [Firmicutes bacterium]|jgi:hypothetical protein|nr:SatD family protein [Bacillota bacterium]